MTKEEYIAKRISNRKEFKRLEGRVKYYNNKIETVDCGDFLQKTKDFVMAVDYLTDFLTQAREMSSISSTAVMKAILETADAIKSL